jgi:hypothetical protein
MMYNNPDPPSSNPNDQPTVANFPTSYSTEPPYPGGQFYQPPYPDYRQPSQPVQPQPRGFDAWFNRQRLGIKIGVGCGAIVLTLTVCIIFSAIASAGSPQTARQTTPTQIVQSNTGLTAIPTAKPTATPKPSPTPTPTATPTPVPTPTPTAVPVQQQEQPTQPLVPTQPPAPTCNGTTINGGCYNYDPSGGTLVYSPPSNFCSYFACVSSFWTATSGYVVKCSDGKHSHSGGVSGACSKNGGVVATVYLH